MYKYESELPPDTRNPQQHNTHDKPRHCCHTSAPGLASPMAVILCTARSTFSRSENARSRGASNTAAHSSSASASSPALSSADSWARWGEGEEWASRSCLAERIHCCPSSTVLLPSVCSGCVVVVAVGVAVVVDVSAVTGQERGRRGRGRGREKKKQRRQGGRKRGREGGREGGNNDPQRRRQGRGRKL